MKTILSFAKILLTVVTFYAYISFAFVDALKTLTYPKSETVVLVKQPLGKDYIAAQNTLNKPQTLKTPDYLINPVSSLTDFIFILIKS